VSHSYQTYFGFPGSDLNLDCGLRDHVITRFASQCINAFIIYERVIAKVVKNIFLTRHEKYNINLDRKITKELFFYI